LEAAAPGHTARPNWEDTDFSPSSLLRLLNYIFAPSFPAIKNMTPLPSFEAPLNLFGSSLYQRPHWSAAEDKKEDLGYNRWGSMRNPEIWVFIFVLGLLGLNWPFLEIFHIDVVSYLFFFWLLFIVLLGFAAHKNRSEGRGGHSL
jgi:hypothetical protein